MALGKSFHTACFTCKTCGKGLDSMNLAEGGDDIFCKNCHLKEFGPKGFRGGGGGVNSTTGIADPVEKVQGGDFCSECGEKQTAGAKFCPQCGAKADAGGASAPAAPGGNVSVANNPWNQPAPKSAAAPIKRTGQAKMKFGGAPQCGACGKSVYEAEKVMGANKAWHQECFLCATCKKGLDSQNITESDGKLYCKSCYGKNFGPKGFGIGGGATHTV